MIRKALRRATYRQRIFVIALLLFVAGLFGAVGVTSAFFQAELDTKTATWAGGYVAVPTIVGAAPNTSTSSGYDGVLTWTNGTDQTTTNNEVQRILGADQGTTTNCSGANYSTTVLNSTTSPTTTQAFTYTDSNRATTPTNINGDWYCYEVVHGWPNTTAPVWTATATTNVQIGLAPISVVITSGGGAGTLSNGDKIVITYNQPVTATTGTTSYCTYQTEGLIFLGDATCAAAATDGATIGKIGMTVTNGGEHAKHNMSVAVSGNTITVTITQNGANVTNTSTRTFVSMTTGNSVHSSAVTDQASPCTAANTLCTLSSANTPATVSGTF